MHFDRPSLVALAVVIAAAVVPYLPSLDNDLVFDDRFLIGQDERVTEPGHLGEIWVTDYRNGEWIDARKAHYVPGKITPMDYGLGATTEMEADKQTLDYAQARAHIYKIEEKYQIHTNTDEHHPNAAPEPRNPS